MPLSPHQWDWPTSPMLGLRGQGVCPVITGWLSSGFTPKSLITSSTMTTPTVAGQGGRDGRPRRNQGIGPVVHVPAITATGLTHRGGKTPYTQFQCCCGRSVY